MKEAQKKKYLLTFILFFTVNALFTSSAKKFSNKQLGMYLVTHISNVLWDEVNCFKHLLIP